MDLMSIRRGLMSQMASGGDKFFEIIDRFTPDENLNEYTFTHSGTGRYIFCEEPILTFDEAKAKNSPTKTLLSGEVLLYETANHTLSILRGMSLTYSTTSNGIVDYWGSRGTLNGSELTIGIAQSNPNFISFRAGHTYVILKMKI